MIIALFLIPRVFCFVHRLSLRVTDYLLIFKSGPAVIGHICCGVPANVLSVCLFVCLFFGEANKIK